MKSLHILVLSLAIYTTAYSNQTIQDALKLVVPATISTTSAGEHEISKKRREKVLEADYRAALEIVTIGLAQFPHSFLLQSNLASLLGDYAQITAEPLKSIMIQRSQELFCKLLQEADTQPKDIFFPFKNEYYFRFAKYSEQHKLGVDWVAHFWGTNAFTPEGVRGYYSQGVGAARYAKQLIENGNQNLAREYAEKAIIAWAQYFSYRNDYYNAYVHYALALGILGHEEEMMRALHKSALLIKRDLDYFEFKEVMDFVKTIKGHTMRTFKNNKLWRDKGIERLEKTGCVIQWRALDDTEFDAQIRAKLLEEAQEAAEAKDREELVSELADVEEVMRAFAKLHGISLEEIEAARSKKYAERGGFEAKCFVELVQCPADSYGEKYFLGNPTKYPEVK